MQYVLVRLSQRNGNIYTKVNAKDSSASINKSLLFAVGGPDFPVPATQALPLTWSVL